jgi:hypothetical protein
MMPRPLTLSIIGGLAILGTATGVALGHSAISEINPAYFAEAPTRFHADRVPNRSTDWAQVQVAEYQAPDGAAGLGTGCFGCSGPIDYVSASTPSASYTDTWLADAERASEPVQAAVVYETPDPEREQIVRYASYQVSSDDEPAALEPETDAEPAAEAEGYAGTVGL